MDSTLLFSVIIPVRNGGPEFIACLEALKGSSFQHWEMIVVDDGSSDGSQALAQHYGSILLHSPNAGPAYARNIGAAAAQGQYLFFVDSDCAVHHDALNRAAGILNKNPSIDALFGSYDDSPAATNFISQYKNLQHHYVHQTSSETAATFWTGCGCVRRDIFVELGGFDAKRYPNPAIEDIEFGYRLIQKGGMIRLAKDVQVKHLKRWTWRTWLAADIRSRAIPWSLLLQEQAKMTSDLNLQWRQRISGLCILSLPPAFIWRALRPAVLLLLLLLLFLNAGFYHFLWHKRGFLFMLKCLPLHWLYYFYSSLVFALVSISPAQFEDSK